MIPLLTVHSRPTTHAASRGNGNGSSTECFTVNTVVECNSMTLNKAVEVSSGLNVIVQVETMRACFYNLNTIGARVDIQGTRRYTKIFNDESA